MIILDTHVLIWAVQDDRKLGVEAALTIEATAADSQLLLPAILAWEVARVEGKQAVVFPGGALAWFERTLARSSFELAPLTPEIAMLTARLDWDHRDPADRMIVATARIYDAPLLTADRAILQYAAAGHLKAIDARR